MSDSAPPPEGLSSNSTASTSPPPSEATSPPPSTSPPSPPASAPPPESPPPSENPSPSPPYSPPLQPSDSTASPPPESSPLTPPPNTPPTLAPPNTPPPNASPPPPIPPPPPPPPSPPPPKAASPVPSPPSRVLTSPPPPPPASPPPASSPPVSSPSDSRSPPPPPPTPVVVPPPTPVVVPPSPSPPKVAPSPGNQESRPPPPPPVSATAPSSPTPPSVPAPAPSSTITTPTPPSVPTPVTPIHKNTTSHSPSPTVPRHISPSKNSSSSPSAASSNSQGNHETVTLVGITVAGVLVALVAIFFVVLRKKNKRTHGLTGQSRRPPSEIALPNGRYHGPAGAAAGRAPHPDANHAASPSGESSYGSYGRQVRAAEGIDPAGSKSWFTYEELMDITNGFSRENHIGEGGFGSVYKGVLQDGREVAVKQLKIGSGQGDREFKAEVEIISRVHHRHLVSLVGYCIAEQHRLLVYEFVSNKTLDHHLHGEGLPVLDWGKRMRIAVGSARGLAYLHEDCHPRIIHRDIKSANILLDESFEAQVADFGLAKLANDAHTHVSTRVMGTFGYLAPEYASSGKLTDRSDVYSFGVVLLELITGRKPVDASRPLGDESLVEWARPLLIHALETGDYEELVDPKLENNFLKADMLRVIEAAAACVRHSAPKRPRMVQVLRALDSEGSLSDLSNGVKFGQSTVYNSGQYSADIQKLRRMAFDSGGFSIDYDHSGEHEHEHGSNSTYSSAEH
ncbi:unnamed protein product [Musa hybrid cultivar]